MVSRCPIVFYLEGCILGRKSKLSTHFHRDSSGKCHFKYTPVSTVSTGIQSHVVNGIDGWEVNRTHHYLSGKPSVARMLVRCLSRLVQLVNIDHCS